MQRIVQFQSTLPRGERRGRCGFQSKSRKFQSTLPRGERQGTLITADYITQISIHAPTRGATDSRACSKIMQSISIHAPTRGATVYYDLQISRIAHFNPRSHEGSDSLRICSSSPFNYFNPRSHEGSDEEKLNQYPITCISIHAPTRGATTL